MITIDKAALIELAATAIDNSSGRYTNYGLTAALPVIAKALLAPLRELHPNESGECWVCGDDRGPLPWPCPTAKLLDAIESEVSA